MNNISVDIKILNYKGQVSLSGYALPNSNFTFIPDLTNVTQIVSIQKVLWDFGDGTTSNSVTATHSYSLPGTYGVKLIVYNRQGTAITNAYVPGITVYDYLKDELIISAPSAFNVGAGYYSSFTIQRQNTWRSVPANNGSDFTVSLYASGSVDPLVNIDQYYNNQWSHLIQNCKFLNKQVAGDTYEYVPVSAITTTSQLVYVNQDSSGEYKPCLSTDTGAVVAGSVGYATPYFTSDQPKNYTLSGESPVIIFATLDNLKIVDSVTIGKNLSQLQGTNYFNLQPAIHPNVRVRYNPATKLVFSTNGISTQGDAVLSTFNIPSISWQYTAIPFIVRLTDSSGYPTKFYPTLVAASNISIPYNIILTARTIGGQTIPGKFYTSFTSAAPTDVGGYYRGYFVPTSAANNVQFRGITLINNPAYYDYTTNCNIVSATTTVTGFSNTFNILSSGGVFNIAKQNEDFDFGAFLGSLRFAEYQYEFGEFFDKFLPAFFGNNNSEPYELGKTIYEKIANFADNNANLDTANIQSLVSMCKEIGFNLEDVNYEYPAQLRRIVDLLSIKHKKLFGDKNNYKTNFNNFFSTSSGFAVNLGTQIDINTGTFPVSASVVAFEKYSGIYRLCNTAILSGVSLSSILALSGINNTWGWPLALPSSVSGIQVDPYYTFYTYNATPQGDILDSVINWNDPQTTLSFNNSSYSTWSCNDGIMDNIINYEFTKGLRLFTSAANIVYNN